MDEIRQQKLRKAVFERLTLGTPREAMHEELCTKLDADAARAILDDAVQEIAAGRERGDYDAAALRTRKHRFKADYLAWRILGGFLAIVGTVYSLSQTLESGSLRMTFGPLAAGLVILAVIEWKVNTRVNAAKDAVDRLLKRAVKPAAST